MAHIDTVTGATTIINHLNGGAYTLSLTYDPADNAFYTVTNLGSYLGLYQVNPDSGAFHLVTPVSAPSYVSYFEAVATSPKDGSLYAADYRTLYSIDKQTGAVAAVGALGAGDTRALTFSPDGTLYGYTLYGGESGPRGDGFFKYDLATGKTTVLTPPGTIPDLFIQGLAFAPDDTLYGAEPEAIVKLDPATGQPENSTRVSLSSFPYPLNAVAFLSSSTATPEPSTVILLSLGIGCCLMGALRARE